MAPVNNSGRVDKIRKLLGMRSDVELSERLNCSQPQISRWRSTGFAKSVSNIIDALLELIAELKRENRKLRKDLRSREASEK